MPVFEIMKLLLSASVAHIKFRVRKVFGIDRKIFVIGRNKTGTTSLGSCLESLGYFLGDQSRGELFIDDYAESDFENILKYCDSAEVFQDAPFSWPGTYRYVFEKYPEAKYILLERESAMEWYQSLVRFHHELLNSDAPITAEALKNCRYRRTGWLWKVQQAVYKVSEENIYCTRTYIDNYERHNLEVKEFFSNSTNFLSLVLSSDDAEEKLAKFLGYRKEKVHIPHLNRTKK